MKTLLICPLKQEWKCLGESLEQQGLILTKKQNQGRWYFEIPAWEAVLCEGRPGTDEFSERLLSWIDFLQPSKQVLTLGACGALTSDLNIGEAVAIQEVVEVVNGVPENPRSLIPMGELPPVTLLALLESLTSTEQAQKWFEQTSAQVIAWETVAGMNVAQKKGLAYSEWRAVTDQANEEAFTDFQKNLPQAMESLSQALLQFFGMDS